MNHPFGEEKVIHVAFAPDSKKGMKFSFSNINYNSFGVFCA